MIMRDHDGMNRSWGHPDLSAAESGVDQDSRPARLDERRIAGATSAQNADLHRRGVVTGIPEPLIRARSFTFRACPLPRPLEKRPAALLE